MLKLLSLLFICNLASCGSFVSQTKDTSSQTKSVEHNQQLKSANQQNDDIELTVIMERFSWTYSLLYKVEIQPDGRVIFEEGKVVFVETEYTKPKVKAESKLEKEKMQQLLSEMETSDFFSLDSGYGYRYKNCPVAMSDNESVKINVKLNGNEKTIDHDLGCLDMPPSERTTDINQKERIFPQKLYKLENKIDEIVETKRWLGGQK